MVLNIWVGVRWGLDSERPYIILKDLIFLVTGSVAGAVRPPWKFSLVEESHLPKLIFPS